MQASSKSFIEILEDEIRKDIRRELEAEWQAKSADQGSVPDAARPATAASAGRDERTAATQAAGRFETWLASHVGPITFKTKTQIYRPGAATRAPGKNPSVSSPNVTPSHAARGAATASATPAPTYTAQTSEDVLAVELLNRHSPVALSTTFTEDELKSVWRKAALKTHPDRFSGADAITQLRATAVFRELAAAYECLSNIVESSNAASARESA